MANGITSKIVTSDVSEFLIVNIHKKNLHLCYHLYFAISPIGMRSRETSFYCLLYSVRCSKQPAALKPAVGNLLPAHRRTIMEA